MLKLPMFLISGRNAAGRLAPMVPKTGFQWARYARESSLGIIGGADGPTAIFVTGNWFDLAVLAAVVIAIAAAVVVFLKKRR